jgi:hypothetical protein
MRVLLVIVLGLAAMTACDGAASDNQPCDNYVDYLCECHPDDPNFTCEEARAQYESASADEQDACLEALGEQQAADEAAGVCQ